MTLTYTTTFRGHTVADIVANAAIAMTGSGPVIAHPICAKDEILEPWAEREELDGSITGNYFLAVRNPGGVYSKLAISAEDYERLVAMQDAACTDFARA